MICPECGKSVAVWRQVRKWEQKYGQDKNVLKNLVNSVWFDIFCLNCKQKIFSVEICGDIDESKNEKPKKKTPKR